MDASAIKRQQAQQYSLRTVAMLAMCFFITVLLLTALVVIPKINQVFESQNAEDVSVDLALKAQLFTQYIESNKTVLQDLAQFPGFVSATMLSDTSDPVLSDLVDNAVIGGENARLVLQDIVGTVLIKSTSKLKGSYDESQPWLEQVVTGAVPYHFQLLGQSDDQLNFKISVPVKYNNFVEGVLSAEITSSLEQIFIAQSYNDHIAFKLVQDDITVSTKNDHIEIAHEASVKLEQPNLTFVYITDTAIIKRKESTLRNTILSVLFIGFAISFILFVAYGYRTQSAIGKVDNGKFAFGRAYIIPMAVLFIGTAASVTAFLSLYYIQNGAIEKEQIGYGKGYVQTIQENIGKSFDFLNSLAAFYDASDVVDRQEFDTFAQSLIAKNSNIQALAWVPNVSSNERSSYEEQAINDGLDGFEFKELGADKRLKVAGIQEQYFPVYYVSPLQGNEKVFGFNLASNPGRLAALSKAGTNGTMAATAPIEMIEEVTSQTGILVFYPVYSKGDAGLTPINNEYGSIQGFVLLVLKAGDIIDESVADHDNIVSTSVRDITDSSNYQGLYGDEISPDNITFSQSIDVAGRTWRIDTIASTANDQMRWMPWLALLGGLIVTLFMTTWLVYLIRRQEIVEALVVQRTAELRTLSSSVDNSTDAFIITQADNIDTETGLPRIAYVNAAFFELTGYTAAESIGKTTDIVQANKTDVNDLTELHQTIQSGGAFRGEMMIKPKSGDAFWVDVNAIAIEGNDGQIVQFVSVLRDITERKQAEVDREKFIDQLTDSNEELARFAYVCSHDLQEPLRMIRSFSERLQTHLADDLINDEKGQKYFRFVIDGAARAQELIADILAYSSIDSDPQNLETVDCNELVDSIESTMQLLLDSRNGLITRDELPELQGNRTQLLQLFQNIVNNGVKYQKPGTAPLVHIGATDVGSHWQFSIHDNGIGMEERHLNKIFDVFQRLHRKDQYAGTGIGLSICKKVVERNGGKLWVESEHGIGSAFYFTLLKPVATETTNEYRRKAG